MTTTPFTARPPRSWEVQTVAVLITIGATALITMILLVTDLGLRNYRQSGSTGAVSPLVAAAGRDPSLLNFLNLIMVCCYLGTYFWWRHRTREMLHRVGAPSGTARTHWAIAAWGLCLGLSFVVRVAANAAGAVDDLDGVAAGLGWDALALTFRLVAVSLLLIGVWEIRATVRRLVAESGVALRTSNLGRTAPTTAVPLVPLTRTEIDTGALPPADDAFWTRVGEQAVAAGADLAVLESTDAVVHRWLLIPATGETDPVRDAVPPGAVVTVFAEPPAATKVEPQAVTVTTAPDADEFYGFLEDADSGALWFQSVRPNRVPAFLARARTARRWALYPADSAAASSALMPAAPAQP